MQKLRHLGQLMETDQRIIFDFAINKNTCAANNLHLHLKLLRYLNQQTKILFICNLLCSRAEIIGNWESVRKAKFLDFTVLLLSDQTGYITHLCVRALNGSSLHVSFSPLFTAIYIQQ